MALMLHAVLGSVVFVLSSDHPLLGCFVIISGAWITCRAAGAFGQYGFASFVTLGLMIASCIFPRETDASHFELTTFVLRVFTVMLGVVFVLDLLDLSATPFGRAMLDRMRRWHWHRILIRVFVVAFIIYMVVIPTIGWINDRLSPPKPGPMSEEMSLAEQFRLRSVAVLSALWFFTLGATIGSFLNVVAYRMPRRESLILRSSRCPKCDTKITRRDNLPILGWLLLEGRCRACQAVISFRYPLVETICATLFLLVYFVELISGGANIPVRQPNYYKGVVWIVLYTKWDLVSLYLFHCFSICALLSWGLIDFDRQKVPRRAKWLACGILFTLPLLWPDLLPVPWLRAVEARLGMSAWLAALTTSFIGGSVGATLGWFARQTYGRALPDSATNTDAPRAGHVVTAGAIVGLSLGWQAAIGTWLIAFAVRIVSLVACLRWRWPTPPITLILLFSFVIQLSMWRWLSVSWWPSYRTSAVAWVSWSLVLGTCLMAQRVLVRRCREIHQSEGEIESSKSMWHFARSNTSVFYE